jgi:hypothetical protein
MPHTKPSPKLIKLANQVQAGADLDWLVRIEGLDMCSLMVPPWICAGPHSASVLRSVQ